MNDLSLLGRLLLLLPECKVAAVNEWPFSAAVFDSPYGSFNSRNCRKYFLLYICNTSMVTPYIYMYPFQ